MEKQCNKKVSARENFFLLCESTGTFEAAPFDEKSTETLVLAFEANNAAFSKLYIFSGFQPTAKE